MKNKGSVGPLLLFIATLVMALIITSALILRTDKLAQDSFQTTQRAGSNTNLMTFLDITGEDGRDHQLQNFTMTIRSAPGAKPLNLEEVNIFVTALNHTMYSYAGTEATTMTDANTTHYAVDYLHKSITYRAGLFHQDDVIRIYFKTPTGIPENQDITIKVMPTYSTESIKMVYVPEILSGKTVQLYPQI